MNWPDKEEFSIKEQYSPEELRRLVAFLRGPEGCPWDKKQTHESMKSDMVEEAWEVVDAIDEKDVDNFKEELGDMLLQVVFHAQLAEEEGLFTLDDVIAGLCQKLISRHSHLFGEDVAKTPEEVLFTWEENKRKEQGTKTVSEELQGVPKSLPQLTRAAKIQKKAAHVGFDWPSVDGAFDKIREETEELSEVIEAGDKARVEEEGGDLLFAAVNTLRHMKVDPELALEGANAKFVRRFTLLEEEALRQGKRLESLSLEELDALWDEAKGKEAK